MHRLSTYVYDDFSVVGNDPVHDGEVTTVVGEVTKVTVVHTVTGKRPQVTGKRTTVDGEVTKVTAVHTVTGKRPLVTGKRLLVTGKRLDGEST